MRNMSPGVSVTNLRGADTTEASVQSSVLQGLPRDCAKLAIFCVFSKCKLFMLV